jgi:hypothetical protein
MLLLSEGTTALIVIVALVVTAILVGITMGRGR